MDEPKRKKVRFASNGDENTERISSQLHTYNHVKSNGWYTKVHSCLNLFTEDLNLTNVEQPSLKESIEQINISNSSFILSALVDKTKTMKRTFTTKKPYFSKNNSNIDRNIENIEDQDEEEEEGQADAHDSDTWENWKEEQDEDSERMKEEELENLVNSLARPCFCVGGFCSLIKCFKNIFCRYTPKIYIKPPTIWGLASDDVDSASLIRDNYLGIIAGILIGFASFIMFTFTFTHAIHIATLASCYCMLFAIFGIAFSRGVRCIVLLVIPYLVASRTRWLLLLLATGLTTMGPGLNFMHNSGNFRNGIACVLGQVSTNVQLIKKITKAPVNIVKDQLDDFIGSINGQMQKIRDTLANIKKALFQVTNVINSKNSWVRTMVEACGDETAMKNQCLAFFNTLYFNCAEAMQSLAFICNVVRMFASQACNSVSGMNDLCKQQSDKLSSQITEVSPVSEAQLEDSEASILRFIGNKNISMETTSSSLIDLDMDVGVSSQAEIVALIEDKMNAMLNTMESFKKGMKWGLVIWTLITMVQLVVQAAIFKRNWLLKIFFANEYVSSYFIAQEKRALINGMRMTLPLSFWERWKFVTYSSIRWSRSERKSAIGSLIFLFLAMIILIGIVVSDYGMYQVIKMTSPTFCGNFGDKGEREQSMVSDLTEDSIGDLGIAADQQTVPEIKGNSSMANMGRAFMSLANPLKDIAFDVDASLCRPKASKPNDNMNIMVLIIIGFTAVSIVLQVYVMRLRHLIMEWYYPDTAQQRAAWLRIYIRNSRGLFHRLVHKFHTRKLSKARGQLRLPFFERYLFMNPVLSGYLARFGIKREYCAYCGDFGNPKKKSAFEEKFSQCSQCSAFFCTICRVDLKGLCLNCNVPLNVLAVDVDFEMMSSDEEYDYFFGKYLRRADHARYILPYDSQDDKSAKSEEDKEKKNEEEEEEEEVEKEEKEKENDSKQISLKNKTRHSSTSISKNENKKPVTRHVRKKKRVPNVNLSDSSD